MSVFTEGQSRVRVPYANIAAMGDLTMNDIEEAAGDPDGAIAVDVDGGPGSFMQADQAGPRVDADPNAILGEDLRPIHGSRESMGIVPDGTAAGDPMATTVASGVPTNPAAPPTDPASRAAGPRQRITPESRFNPNYRYTNEDFYGPRGPDIYSQNAVGGQLYIPRAGELPMGLFASYQQDNQRKKEQIDKGISDLLKSTQVKPTADPYQPAFTKLVTDWKNNFAAGIAEQYSGDSAQAWKEIAKVGSDANVRFLDGMRAMDALGQFVKFQWADAESYIKDVMKGEIGTTPEQKQRAIDVFYGIGNLKGDMAGGDFAKLAQETEALKRDMNEAKYIKEYALPMFPEVYKKVSSEPVVKIIGGKRVLSHRTREEADAAAFKMMADMGSDMTGLDPDALEARLAKMFPRVKSDIEETKFFPEPKDDGSSKDGGEDTGTWFGNLERGVSPTMVESFTGPSTDPVDIISGKTTTNKVGKGTVNRLPIGEIVSKRKQNMGPRKFTNEQGESVEMRPQYIEQDQNGGLYIVGRPVAEEDTSTSTTDLISETDYGEGVKMRTTERLSNKPQPKWVSVPVSQNESAIDQYMGGSEWRNEFPSIGPRKMSYLETDPAPQPSRSQLADEWQAMKNANPKMTAQQVTDAINKKYKLK